MQKYGEPDERRRPFSVVFFLSHLSNQTTRHTAQSFGKLGMSLAILEESDSEVLPHSLATTGLIFLFCGIMTLRV